MQDKIGLRSSLRHELIYTFKSILRLYTDVLVKKSFDTLNVQNIITSGGIISKFDSVDLIGKIL
ncbi:MAG: hypothetical protein ACKESC_00520 [Candidatus Hodgkinia cicadicola]